MSKKYFNINLEFDQNKVDQVIQDAIKKNIKGYVCSVEGNILANANINKDYLKIVNNSLVNICDGFSIALLASLIHLKRHTTYIGADLFIRYIKMNCYRSYFLGNTDEVLSGLKYELSKLDPKINDMQFHTLPFLNVNEFDYPKIAKDIIKDKPDIIWISLGAPKQEIFMSKLLPYLNKGIMFGFGAILNFYSNNSTEKRAPKIFLKFKLEWLFRLVISPKKQYKKIILILSTYPKIILTEIYKKVTKS